MKQKNQSDLSLKSSGHFNLIGFCFELATAFLVLSISLLSSCGKETMEITSPSYNYFPTERGKFVIYNVDSIVHATNDHDNDDSVYYYSYQVKEVIDSSIIDGEGIERQIVIRYFRSDTTQDWNINSIWTQSLNSTSAYRWEENIPYHKLSFPISGNIEWNGNDKNTLDEVLLQYEDIHQPYSINGLSFDSTIVVTDNAIPNAVEDISNLEVYATGVGMIYKENINLRKTSGQVVSGIEFTMTVFSYGN
jgi:hypothetical protein